jgi:hypothetical protein
VWELVRSLSVHIYAAQEVLEPAIAEVYGGGEGVLRCVFGRLYVRVSCVWLRAFCW